MATHRRPPRAPSPSPSVASNDSIDSHSSWDGGSSPALHAILNGFEAGSHFSQFNASDGRGKRVVAETRSLLEFIASNGKENPAMSFDRFDGRAGKPMYLPPQRAPGGIMLRCRLANDNSLTNGQNNTILVNQVSNNITFQASTQVQKTNNTANFIDSAFTETHGKAFGSGKRRTKRQTCLQTKSQQTSINKNKVDSKFKRKKLASPSLMPVLSPPIPVLETGLRSLLKHWVLGDVENGVPVPLSAFTIRQRNGKQPSGTKMKALYSKRRTVALAVMLALRIVVEEKVDFKDAIGVKSVEGLGMREWERVARSFLSSSASRKLSEAEIVDLGRDIYCEETLAMLPPDTRL